MNIVGQSLNQNVLDHDDHTLTLRNKHKMLAVYMV